MGTSVRTRSRASIGTCNKDPWELPKLLGAPGERIRGTSGHDSSGSPGTLATLHQRGGSIWSTRIRFLNARNAVRSLFSPPVSSYSMPTRASRMSPSGVKAAKRNARKPRARVTISSEPRPKLLARSAARKPRSHLSRRRGARFIAASVFNSGGPLVRLTDLRRRTNQLVPRYLCVAHGVPVIHPLFANLSSVTATQTATKL